MRATNPLARRKVWLALAMLAVAVRVLIPAGFMASTDADLPYALVICTGQGAVSVQAHDLDGQHDPASETHHASCAFAGIGGAPPPPLLTASVAVVFAQPAPVAPWTTAVLRPGRGLAAPPPPATGPPQLTI